MPLGIFCASIFPQWSNFIFRISFLLYKFKNINVSTNVSLTNRHKNCDVQPVSTELNLTNVDIQMKIQK